MIYDARVTHHTGFVKTKICFGDCFPAGLGSRCETNPSAKLRTRFRNAFGYPRYMGNARFFVPRILEY